MLLIWRGTLLQEIVMIRISRSILIHFPTLLLLMSAGNRAAAQQQQSQQTVPQLNLLEGSVVEYGFDAGFSYSAHPPVIGPGESARFLIRTTFTYYQAIDLSFGNESPYSFLEFTPGGTLDSRRIKFSINGKPIGIPLEGMAYRTIPAIDAGILRSGLNSLTGEVNVRNSSSEESMTLSLDMKLIPLRSSDLRFQTGPILGAYDSDYFTVTCRTNMPANVFVYRSEVPGTSGAGGRIEYLATSETGLIHRLRVPRPIDRSEEPVKYVLAAERDGHLVEFELSPDFPAGDNFRFIATGDSRTYPERWKTAADAIAGAEAELMIHLGDLVTSGERDWEWDEQFWAPASSLLSSRPVYAVIGNHERQAPLFDELLYSPSEDGRAHNWYQEKKGVLLIGIDGQQDWSAGSDNEEWLEEVLAGSNARFIFLAMHYPAWSSARHGRVDEDGIPDERTVRESRDVVMPLLEKYQATAMIAGHDHTYERSEPPGGVSVIIAGGGGAPSYAKQEDAERQNPHSVIFASALHYCLFEVNGDTCTMRAFALDGEVIDIKTWKARGTR